MKTQGEVSRLQQVREASEETNPADILILNCSLQSCEKTSFCCVDPRVPSTWSRQP